MFFVATKKFVQVYDLQKAEVVKKLESGLREISSISIHPGGKYKVNCILIYQLIYLENSGVRTNGSAALFVGLPY